MRRPVIATLSIATAGLLAFASPALADTAKIGSALALPYDGGVSTSSGTVTIQQSQSGGALPFPLTSPANGIVTEWAVRTSDDAALYTLRIFRPAGVNTYTGVGRVVAPQAVPAGTTDAILTYPGNSLPIEEGDHIGLLQTGVPDDGIAQNTTNGITTNVFANLFTGDPLDGVPTTFLPDQQHELLLQATVEYCTVPKVKKKGRKKAKKRIVRAGCSVKVKKKRAKNPKQLKKVVKQKPKPGSTLPPGGRVVVFVGK